MKNFTKLTMAAALAAVSFGSSAATQLSTNNLGDMAIVPYYTVRGDYSTGLHIINTSGNTQVIKIRLRRALDSMDALDFNLIMSPDDEWTAFLGKDKEGRVTLNTGDTTCTAPEIFNNTIVMPELYSKDADTGYIEVIGMGSATPDQPISVAALHADGVPADCEAVRSNFFANNSKYNKPVGDVTRRGVLSSVQTNQTTETGVVTNSFGDTGDVLKVTYHYRNTVDGTEFGSNAVTFSGFMQDASITNQEFGVFDGDMQGFDFPDLNGGAPLSALNGIGGKRGKYEEIRDAIGGASVINDWSTNTGPGFEVSTDWVITFPGQYTMLDLPKYLASLQDEEKECGLDCDYRDLTVTASFNVFDREERGIVTEDGGLVISPAYGEQPQSTLLGKEVNVIEWGEASVLDAPETTVVEVPDGAQNGWAELDVTSSVTNVQSICDFTNDVSAPVVCTPVDDVTAVPVLGFIAWKRIFENANGANYGRIIDHSYSLPAGDVDAEEQPPVVEPPVVEPPVVEPPVVEPEGEGCNNGVGNGVDCQPPGNPPVNDGEGQGPGNPGNNPNS